MDLTALDRRVVGALMLAPRAPWRQIAAVLGEPERTVARRGAELLESGVVSVAGLVARPYPVLIAVRTAPGTMHVASRALAALEETSFVYETTGQADCLAELMLHSQQVHRSLSEEMPAVAGVQHVVSSPILRYFKTLREWEPDLLTPHERQALRPRPLWDPTRFGHYPPLDRRDLDVVAALRADGRATAESVGRAVGVSEATARRRIAWLLDNAVVHVRTLVEPGVLGLPVQAILWIKAPPHAVEGIGQELAGLAMARYVAALAGEHQILADITLATLRDLYDFITDAPWAASASQVTPSVVLRAQKRGGVRVTEYDAEGVRFRQVLP